MHHVIYCEKSLLFLKFSCKFWRETSKKQTLLPHYEYKNYIMKMRGDKNWLGSKISVLTLSMQKSEYFDKSLSGNIWPRLVLLPWNRHENSLKPYSFFIDFFKMCKCFFILYVRKISMIIDVFFIKYLENFVYETRYFVTKSLSRAFSEYFRKEVDLWTR